MLADFLSFGNLPLNNEGLNNFAMSVGLSSLQCRLDSFSLSRLSQGRRESESDVCVVIIHVSFVCTHKFMFDILLVHLLAVYIDGVSPCKIIAII